MTHVAGDREIRLERDLRRVEHELRADVAEIRGSDPNVRPLGALDDHAQRVGREATEAGGDGIEASGESGHRETPGERERD